MEDSGNTSSTRPEEPSVLDYLRGRLRGRIPAERWQPPEKGERKESTGPGGARVARVFVTVGLVLAGQSFLEPGARNVPLALLFYALGLAFLVWSIFRREVTPAGEAGGYGGAAITVRRDPLIGSLILVAASFVAFGGGRFTPFNVALWAVAIGATLWAVWESAPDAKPWTVRAREKLRGPWTLRFSWWSLLVFVVILLVIFFRVYRLGQVPGEMVSDHAEKLLDVSDVLAGKTSIFFPRNTGREAIQFYLTAAIATVLGTGVSFISLKIGTVLAGLLTLPYIYLLGKELGNRWVGLLAVLLAGIAYWPNVISRFGLRFPFYPLFAAPALYYLVRGLRYGKRNDFVLSGAALGLGLQGYTPMRIVPFVVVLGVALYMLHPQARGKRYASLINLLILAYVALVFFLPLGRYALDNPGQFAFRAFSRLVPIEQALPAPPLQVFFSNLGKAWIMPFFDDGQIWVHSVPGRPALDVVSAVLYLIGSVLVLVRYLRRRDWADLFLLLLVPLLMLPSILSLAFPNENPSLNRTGAAIIPVFVLAGIGLESVVRTLAQGMGPRWGRAVAGVVALGLVTAAALQNYDLVFRQYNQEFLAGTWNSSEMGHLVRGFADSVGNENSAYVVAYPYWVDTRLVGINAGYPTKDYAIQPDQLAGTKQIPGAKLFLVNLQDGESLASLERLYPSGAYWEYRAAVPGKDFWVYLVPPASGLQGTPQ
jgi:4-amino-4-deoxy-L-arabinose transferase-like glycosyltransferase